MLLIKYFLISLSIFSIFQKDIIATGPDNKVKLTYSFLRGITGEPNDSFLGYKTIIYYDGKIEKYSIHQMSPDILLKTSQISVNDIKDLDSLFTEFKFDDYPTAILPKSKMYRWPHSSCDIYYSKSENDKGKRLKVPSFYEIDHAPNGFMLFLKKLENKLESFF
jgi:hypothetical protein